MRKFLVTAAYALAAIPGLARAAEPVCLTPSEFTALSTYALPSIISGTASRCATILPTDAYLRHNTAALVSRYSLGKPAAWPAAKAAFLKFSVAANPDAGQMLKGIPDPTLQQLVDGGLNSVVTQKLPLDRCITIDRIVGLLSPLPAENTAQLLAITVGLAAKSGKARVGNFTLCPA